MDILNYAAQMQDAFTRMEANEFGYKTITTFMQDFSIADCFGVDAVNDTFNRAWKSWKRDIKYVAEMAMVLNQLCWYHHNKRNELSDLYHDLYYKVHDAVYADDSIYTEEERKYYFEITD